MKKLNVLRQSLIGAGFLLLVAGPVLGQWQQRRDGQSYVYWQNGSDFAFPISNRPNWFYWSSRGQDGNPQWWHPEYEDPQTRVIRYLGFWTNGSRISQKYSTSDYWTEWQDCDLVALKKWADETDRNFATLQQPDYRAYYLAQRNEAQSLFGACKQIKFRLGGR
jgi:hypothetical protein